MLVLEPEILDELGLFIRLDDAASKYAATLGKTANELTNTERRAAFLNEALEQGAKKFGLVSEADVNVFDQMSATFRELAESFLQIVNVAVIPFMQLLAANTVLLLGGIVLLGGNIAKALIPALFNMGNAAAFNARVLKGVGKELAVVATQAELASQSLLKASKTSIGGKGSMFGALMGKASSGKASAAELLDLDKMYKKSIAIRLGQLKKLTGAEALASKARIAAMRLEQAALRATMTEMAAKAAMEKAAATGAAAGVA